MDERGRTLSGVVCDDIRQEVFGKVSLIGCYGPVLEVSEFPATLPKLCFHARVESPLHLGWGDGIVLKVLKDDEVLLDGIIQPSADALGTGEDVRPGARILATINFVLSPLQLDAPCSLRVRAYFGDEEVKGLGVRVRLNESLRIGSTP